jgi:hypothetical protein
MCGVNVEKTDFIRACGVIASGCLNRIARVAKANKIHALDHTAICNIEARDQSGFKH